MQVKIPQWLTRYGGVILLVLVGALAVWGMERWPLGTEEISIIKSDIDPELVPLQRGEVWKQEFKVPAGTYSGLILFSEGGKLDGRHLDIVVRDTDGEEVAKSGRTKVTYGVAGQYMRLTIPLDWFEAKEQDMFSVELQLPYGESLPLRLVGGEHPFYGHGTFYRNGQAESRDLALLLLARRPLPQEAKPGIVAGLIVMAGVAALSGISSLRWRWVVASVLLVISVPVALTGYWVSLGRLGINDWDYYFSLHHGYRESLVRHQAFPFWNPYTCGGTAGLGDPEFPVFMPTFWLELLFGIPLGLRLAILLAATVGSLGLLMLARRLGLSPPAGVLAAIAGALGTVNLLEITEGHVNVFATMWIPWIFWAWLAAYRTESTKVKNSKFEYRNPKQYQNTENPNTQNSGVLNFGHLNFKFVSDLVLRASDFLKFGFRIFGRRKSNLSSRNSWILICGIFLALTFYQGGIYLLMYTVLAFIVLPFLVKRPAVAIKITFRAGLWALGLASLKLIPVLLWLREFPDEAYAGSSYTLPWLFEILFGRHLHGSEVIFDQRSGWHEYGAYIGYVVAGLSLLGLSLIKRRRVVLALTAAIILVILLSTLGPFLVPVFDLMWWFPRSNISRVILFAIIPLALLAGFGVDRLRQRGPAGSRLAWLLIGLAAIDILSLSSQLAFQAFVVPDSASPPRPDPIAFTARDYKTEVGRDTVTRAYVAAREGYGTLSYCSVLGPKPAVEIVESEIPKEYLQVREGKATQLTLQAWSPNRVEVAAKNEVPMALTLNSNYSKGWLVNNEPAAEMAGLVGVRLEPGEHVLTFQYRPPGFRAGVAIFIVTLALVVWRVLKTVSVRPDGQSPSG